LLTLGSFSPLGGLLGGIFGERRVFAIGLGGFGATLAALCGGADDRAAGGIPRAARDR
jgi:MFS family permease